MTLPTLDITLVTGLATALAGIGATIYVIKIVLTMVKARG